MTKELLIEELSNHAYSISYTCNKHFATYDIVEKVPGGIGLFTMIIGIVQLRYPNWKHSIDISMVLIILGVIGLYISFYNHKKDSYNEKGIKLSELYNKITQLYREVKSDNYTEEAIRIEIDTTMDEFYKVGVSQQIMISDWYAHYKMFIKKKTRTQWFVDELEIPFWGGKVPLTFVGMSFLLIVLVTFLIVYLTGGF